MKHRITRRDFLNGTQVAIGTSLLTPWTDIFGANATDFSLGSNYYPPVKTGLRGSHDGSWETIHARVAGATWPVGEIEEAATVRGAAQLTNWPAPVTLAAQLSQPSKIANLKDYCSSWHEQIGGVT